MQPIVRYRGRAFSSQGISSLDAAVAKVINSKHMHQFLEANYTRGIEGFRLGEAEYIDFGRVALTYGLTFDDHPMLFFSRPPRIYSPLDADLVSVQPVFLQEIVGDYTSSVRLRKVPDSGEFIKQVNVMLKHPYTHQYSVFPKTIEK